MAIQNRLVTFSKLYECIQLKSFKYVYYKYLRDSLFSFNYCGNKIFLRPKETDFNIFEDIFLRKSYDFYLDFKPNIIVDCGANIGLSSIFFAIKYPNAKVIAIEPERKNYKMLSMNIAKYDSIRSENKGIWGKTCNLCIQDENVGSWSFRVSETVDEINSISSISMLDLISYYQIDQIDILKIDIEGAEKDLFEDQNIDKWLPLVKVIVIELHDRFKIGCSSTFFKALLPYNYSLKIQGECLLIEFL